MHRRNLILFALSAIFFWTCKKSDPQVALRVPVKTDARADTNTGVCIGNSIIAGHPWRYSGLEVADLSYPDTFGQISYHLTQLTGFQWYDRGWGGQTTVQIRNRFLRDAIGDTCDPGDGRGALPFRCGQPMWCWKAV